MIPLITIGALVAAVAGFARWATRRQRVIDTYHERAYRDPPITDAGDWLGGGRM